MADNEENKDKEDVKQDETENKEIKEVKEVEETKETKEDEKELVIETLVKKERKKRADSGKPHNFKSKPKINQSVKKEKPVKDDNENNEDIDIFNNKSKSDNNQTYIYIGIFIVGMIALLPMIVIFLKKDNDSTSTGNNPGWKPISQ